MGICVRESVLCLLMNGCARTDVDRLKIRSALGVFEVWRILHQTRTQKKIARCENQMNPTVSLSPPMPTTFRRRCRKDPAPGPCVGRRSGHLVFGHQLVSSPRLVGLLRDVDLVAHLQVEHQRHLLAARKLGFDGWLACSLSVLVHSFLIE